MTTSEAVEDIIARLNRSPDSMNFWTSKTRGEMVTYVSSVSSVMSWIEARYSSTRPGAVHIVGKVWDFFNDPR